MEKIRQSVPEKTMMEDSSDAAAVPDRRRCFGKRRAAYECAECAVFRLPVDPRARWRQPARRSAAPAASAAEASAERRAVPRPADGKRLAAPAAGDGGNRRAGAVRNVQHAHAYPHRPD